MSIKRGQTGLIISDMKNGYKTRTNRNKQVQNDYNEQIHDKIWVQIEHCDHYKNEYKTKINCFKYCRYENNNRMTLNQIQNKYITNNNNK